MKFVDKGPWPNNKECSDRGSSYLISFATFIFAVLCLRLLFLNSNISNESHKIIENLEEES